MKTICYKCGNEFDWDSEEIFVQPYGYTVNFICRDCLKLSRKYKQEKIFLKR